MKAPPLVRRLDEFCEVVQGGRHKLSGNDFVQSGFPAYGAGGMNGLLPSFEFDRSAVVLSSIGARCGKCFFTKGKWSSLANTQVILPDESQASSKFLWFQLNDEPRWPRAGTGQPFIKPTDVKAHKVFLPPLPEQHRVAEVLERAETLRAQRRQALAQLDALAESIFLSLLNDPASAPWARPTIGEIATTMRTGPFGSQLLHSEFVDSGIAVLGIDNVVQNRFVWARPRYITESKFSQLERYRVEAGDVLITIMGTCGRCAIVPDDVPLAINTKHLCCIRLDQQRCLPTYLQTTLLRHPEVLYRLGVHERGAVMPGLNMQLPVLGFEDQQAAARMQHDEIRVRLLRADRHVIPDEVVGVELFFEPLGEPALAWGHARDTGAEGRDQGGHAVGMIAQRCVGLM